MTDEGGKDYKALYLKGEANLLREMELSNRLASAFCDTIMRQGKVLRHYEAHIKQAAELIALRDAYEEDEFIERLVRVLVSNPEGVICDHE